MAKIAGLEDSLSPHGYSDLYRHPKLKLLYESENVLVIPQADPDDIAIRSIVAEDGYLYMVNQAPPSTWKLFVYDIHDLENPVAVADVDRPTTSLDMLKKGKYLFIASTGLKIYDVEDPTNPVLVRELDGVGSIHGMFIRGDYIYLCGYTQNRFSIADISNPTNAFATFTTTDLEYLNGCHDVYVDENLIAYITNYLDDASPLRYGLTIFDVSDPYDARMLSFTNDEVRHSYVTMNVAINGGKYVWAGGHGGAQPQTTVYDVTDPNTPVEIAYHADLPTGYWQDWYGDYLISMGDIPPSTDYGLSIVDVTDVLNPVVVDSVLPFGTGWETRHFEVKGNLVFAHVQYRNPATDDYWRFAIYRIEHGMPPPPSEFPKYIQSVRPDPRLDVTPLARESSPVNQLFNGAFLVEGNERFASTIAG